MSVRLDELYEKDWSHSELLELLLLDEVVDKRALMSFRLGLFEDDLVPLPPTLLPLLILFDWPRSEWPLLPLLILLVSLKLADDELLPCSPDCALLDLLLASFILILASVA